MALKTFGARTFAALAFGALALHGVAPEPVQPPAVPSFGGGGFSSYSRHEPRKDERLSKRKQEDEIMVQIIVMAVSEGLI